MKAALQSGARRLIEVAVLLPCRHKAEIILDALDARDPVAEYHATYAAKLVIERGVSVEHRGKLRKKLEPKAESATLVETGVFARDALDILDAIK